MRIAVIIRWLIVAAFSYPALAASWFLIFQEPVHPGGFRGNVFIPFIILFPPIWAFIVVLVLRERRVLAPMQYVTLSVMGLFFTQVLILVWAAGVSGAISAVTWHSRGPFHYDWRVIGILIIGALGFLPVLYAAYVALERFPRPLGVSRSD